MPQMKQIQDSIAMGVMSQTNSNAESMNGVALTKEKGG